MKASNLAAIVGGVTLGALGIAMAVTNPQPDAYQEFATETMVEYLTEDGCDQLPQLLSELGNDSGDKLEIPQFLGNLLQNNCPTLIETSSPLIKKLIAENTDRQNLFLFSIYDTDLSFTRYLPKDQFSTVGIFNKFFIYQADKKSS